VLARVHARFRTPVLAILLTAAAAGSWRYPASFIYLVKVTLIARISVYAITCATLRSSGGAPTGGGCIQVPAGPAVAYGCRGSVRSVSREQLDARAVGCSTRVADCLIIFGLTRFARRAPVARIT